MATAVARQITSTYEAHSENQKLLYFFFINQFLYLQVKRSLSTVTELFQFRGSICIKVNCSLPPLSQKILQSGGNQMLLHIKGVF